MTLINFHAATDIGQRQNNEDCFACYPDIGLWIVADGMGGHAAGEVASAITATSLHHALCEQKNFTHAVEYAHQAVLEGAAQGLGGQGMGSTLVALQSNHTHYSIAWVGDSRAYLWRAKQRTLTQLTKDHSYVQALYESGAISKEAIQNHQDKNVITQCIGSDDIESLEIPVISGVWQPDETIILCSDGLTDNLSSELLGKTIANSRSLKAMTRTLIEQALEHGADDNITVCAVSAPNVWHRWLNRHFGRYLSRNNIAPF